MFKIRGRGEGLGGPESILDLIRPRSGRGFTSKSRKLFLRAILAARIVDPPLNVLSSCSTGSERGRKRASYPAAARREKETERIRIALTATILPPDIEIYFGFKTYLSWA